MFFYRGFSNHMRRYVDIRWTPSIRINIGLIRRTRCDINKHIIKISYLLEQQSDCNEQNESK